MQSGIDIQIDVRTLGHQSVKTTEIYTHITDQLKSLIRSTIDDIGL
ncbi:MAG: hypothetical protein IPN72_14725 [Saprospiraceae bacterium]|nr:hypothetical protein [Saprospiraceae bacterium]